MARVSIYSAVINTVIGSVVIWKFGRTALVAWVLVGPLVTFLLGHVYVSRLPKVDNNPAGRREMAQQWKMLLRVGSAFMVAALVGTLVQLWIRVAIQGHLGADALGHYQAAWTISTQYLGFVLGAMGADYYPRLTGVIHDSAAATRLVNEQTEIALLLATPVIMIMLGLAPWIISLLYSSAFEPAVGVIRWQLLGDVLKVASFPLGYVIVAAGDAKTFLWTETTALLLMGGLIVGLAPFMGIQITGIASLASYAYLLPVVYFVARRKIGFAWTRSVVRLLAVAVALCGGIAALSAVFTWGAFVSIGLSLLFGFYSLGRVSHASDLKGPVGRAGAFAYRVTSRFGL